MHEVAGLARDAFYLRPDTYVTLAEESDNAQVPDHYFSDHKIQVRKH